ncbi:MAG: HD-GYP domain-containing protein [Nitrospiraceae bacterium]
MARLTDLIRHTDYVPPLAGPSLTSLRPDGPPPVAVEPDGELSDREWYQRAILEVSRIGCAVAEQRELDLKPLTELATALASSTRHQDHLLRQAVSGAPVLSPLAANCVNVAIMGNRLAQGLGYSPAECECVTLAGLVHDVGMFLVPDSLVAKPQALTSGERALVYHHPRNGAMALSQVDASYRWLASIVEQEHERWDGQGYPHRLSGPKIHRFAQVIGLADVLDALVNPRPYRQTLSAHQAVHQIVTVQKHVFPEDLLRSLLNRISLYPPGTRVRLSTGEAATVERLNPRTPLRPVVHLVDSPTSTEQVLDLSRVPSVHIVEVVTHSSSGDART